MASPDRPTSWLEIGELPLPRDPLRLGTTEGENISAHGLPKGHESTLVEVNPWHPNADPAEHFVAYGPGPTGDIIGGDRGLPRGPQNNYLVALDGFPNVRKVDHELVHCDPAHDR